MNGKIRNALDARAIPAADRKMGRRPSPESGSSKGPIALFLSGVIFAALLGLAQPGAAGQSASVADDYSVLRDFVQSKDAAEPTPVAAEQSNPPGDAYHSALRASAQAGAAGQSASVTDD